MDGQTPFAVLRFGGSNCDRDTQTALQEQGIPADITWYKEARDELDDYLGAILPGGFSYGDYLRAGAIAARDPVMEDIETMADAGKPVLGVCNGAQILCEADLTPGAYTVNRSARFQCEPTYLRVETTDSPFTQQYEEGDVLELPIAHGEGRYVPDDLDRLYEEDRVLFRYVDEDGNATADANPNGSTDNIAGVLGEQRNVAAMMPHPERAVFAYSGSTDGRPVFDGMMDAAYEYACNNQ